MTFNLLVCEVLNQTIVSHTRVDDDASNVKLGHLFNDNLLIIFKAMVLAEVHNDILALKVLPSVLQAVFSDLIQLLFHLLRIPRHHTDVEALPCQLLAHGEADAVGATGDHRPRLGAFGTVLVVLAGGGLGEGLQEGAVEDGQQVDALEEEVEGAQVKE